MKELTDVAEINNFVDNLVGMKKELTIRFEDPDCKGNVQGDEHWCGRVFKFKKMTRSNSSNEIEISFDNTTPTFPRTSKSSSRFFTDGNLMKIIYYYDGISGTEHELTIHIIERINHGEESYWFLYFIEHVDHSHNHVSTGGGGRD